MNMCNRTKSALVNAFCTCGFVGLYNVLWVCIMGKITLLMTELVCVCVCVCTGWLSLLTKGPRYTDGQPCFLGMVLAPSVISWAFAHVQHGAL